jgi:hypothetical protein
MRIACRKAWAAVAAGAVLLLTGCPYSADQPLGDPATAPLDRSLSGTWRSEDPESHQVNTITFAAFNGHEMVGFARENGSDDKAFSAFRLFVTPVGGENFLNLKELRDEEESQWYFARYRIDGDTLTLRLVDDGLFSSKSFPTSEALRGFVRAHLADPQLYGNPGDQTPDMVLTRIPK